MTTWKQELAEEVTAIEDVNAINVKMQWHLKTESDRFSAITSATESIVESDLKVKSPRGVAVQLIDGLNYQAGDQVIECGYLNYLSARNEQELSEARPLGENYGIKEGVDGLEIAGQEWKIVKVEGLGLLTDEESGEVVPAKLRLVVRK